jgi:hypothetical protein
MKLAVTRFDAELGPDAREVRHWVAGGRPNTWVKDQVESRTRQWLLAVRAQRQQGRPMTAGSMGRVSDTTAMVEDTWQRSQHIYRVESVAVDASGNPTSLTLQDPYGGDRTITDVARLYYLLSRAARLELL